LEAKLKKIKLLFTFIVLLTTFGYAQSKFYLNNRATFNSNQTSIAFVSENEGWICGPEGSILHTTDGGLTWESQKSNVSVTLRDIQFLDKNTGFIAGDDINFLKTTDGGKNWTNIKVTAISDATTDLYKIKFFSATTGVILGYKSSTTGPGYILKTTDGGTTWTITATNASKSFLSFDFFSSTNGVMTGKDFNTISYTTDGGSTWTAATAPTDVPSTIIYTRSDLFTVCMASNNVVYASGWGSTSGPQPTILIKSTDGGKTWKYMAQQEANKSFFNNSDIYFKDENTGIVVGGSSTQGGCVYKTTDGGVNFILQPIASGPALKRICVVGNTMYILGDNGLIFKSSDMGTTLTCLTVNNGTLATIAFPSNNVGYAGGISSGAFIKTTDGGQSWKTKFILFPPSSSKSYRSAAVQQFYFLNDNLGYCANRSDIITKTTDGGNSWTVLLDDPITSHVFNSVYMVDQNTGWVVGRWAGTTPTFNYGILKISNGSTISYQDTSGKAGELMSVTFTDVNNGIAVGKGGNIVYTTNGGTNWTKATSGVTTNLSDVKYITPAAVIAVGDTSSTSGTIILSLDGGKTWTQPSTQVPKYSLNAITIKSLTEAFISGFIPKVVKGTLIKLSLTGGTVSLTDLTDTTLFETNLVAITSTPGGDIFIAAVNSAIVYSSKILNGVKIPIDGLKGYALNQNYPNPFNPSTTIEFTIPKSANVNVKIYDILGKEVKSLINDKFDMGTHKIAWDGKNNFGSSVATGIYYYKINSNDFVSVKKMMYLK
jgi:photosystem II stability/assembly factor-like uncharacterized protein